MAKKIERKRGAPKGNRNAVKHGYYSRAFKEEEQFDFNLAAGMEGITEEIALIRFQIKKAVSGGDIKNLMPLVKAAIALEKLIRTHHKLYLGKRDTLQSAVENVIRDVLVPFGVDIRHASMLQKTPGKIAPGIDRLEQKTSNPENEADLPYNKKQISEAI